MNFFLNSSLKQLTIKKTRKVVKLNVSINNGRALYANSLVKMICRWTFALVIVYFAVRRALNLCFSFILSQFFLGC